jgi:hypothetical protein
MVTLLSYDGWFACAAVDGFGYWISTLDFIYFHFFRFTSPGFRAQSGMEPTNDDEVADLFSADSGALNGSGFMYLHSRLHSNDASEQAKRIIVDLLSEVHVDLSRFGRQSLKTRAWDEVSAFSTAVLGSKMSDATALQLVSRGEISLFCTVLSVIENASTSGVSAKHVLQTCVLAVSPSLAPGLMDAREIILAVLHFLSQSWSPSDLDRRAHGLDGLLPLLRPLSNASDLERRSYEKSYDWILSDIAERVSSLEWCFFSCGENLKWLPREKFLPVMQDAKAQYEIMLRGHTDAKIQQPGAAGKRAATENEKLQVVAQPSARLSVATEASRIMSETQSSEGT